MRIGIGKDLCCGAGTRVLAAPAVFDQNDDGTVIVLRATPGAEQRAAVKEAVEERCPTAAVRFA